MKPTPLLGVILSAALAGGACLVALEPLPLPQSSTSSHRPSPARGPSLSRRQRSRVAAPARSQSPEAKGELSRARDPSPAGTPAEGPAGVALGRAGQAQVEIALSVDGGSTGGVGLRYRREGEEAWRSAELVAGRARLPLDPRGKDSLEFKVLGASGEALHFAFEGDEPQDWGQLTTSEVLRGAEAEWAPDGYVLGPDEGLIRVSGFSWRGVSGLVRDAEGRPAAGVEVFIRGRSTRTDTRGRYVLQRPIGRGASFLAVHARDGRGAFAATRVPTEEFSGPASLQLSGVDLRLERTLTLRGKISDSCEEPLEAYVEVAGQPRVRSGADGSYAVPGIPIDPERRVPRSKRVVRVWRAGYRAEEIELEIRPGAPLDVTLAEAQVREGRVVDENGSPLSGVTVRVSNTSETALLGRGWQSDEDCSETLTGQDGTFRLVATRDQAFICAEAADRLARRWNLGGHSGPLTLELPARATIRGSLLDGRGKPRHGQLLAVSQGDSPRANRRYRPRFEGDLKRLQPPPVVAESYTEEGGFELRVEEGQTYDLYVRRGCYEAPVQVASGIEAGRRGLRVVDPARSPAALRLRAISSAGGLAGAARACFVGHGDEWLVEAEEGELEVWGSQGGSYVLWVVAPGHRPVSMDVQLQDGQVKELGEVVLQRGGGELEIVLPRREPFGELFLNYRDPSGGPLRQARAGTSIQALRLSGLTSGLLKVEVTLVDEDYSGTCGGGGDPFPRMVLEAVIREGCRERLEVPLPD